VWCVCSWTKDGLWLNDKYDADQTDEDDGGIKLGERLFEHLWERQRGCVAAAHGKSRHNKHEHRFMSARAAAWGFHWRPKQCKRTRYPRNKHMTGLVKSRTFASARGMCLER